MARVSRNDKDLYPLTRDWGGLFHIYSVLTYAYVALIECYIQLQPIIFNHAPQHGPSHQIRERAALCQIRQRT